MRFIVIPKTESRDWNYIHVYLSDFSSTRSWCKCVLKQIYLENCGIFGLLCALFSSCFLAVTVFKESLCQLLSHTKCSFSPQDLQLKGYINPSVLTSRFFIYKPLPIKMSSYMTHLP